MDFGKNLLSCGFELALGSSDFDEERSRIRTEWEDIFTNTDMYNLKKDEIKIKFPKLGDGAFCSVFPVHVRNGKTKEFNENLPPFALKQVSMNITEGENERLLLVASTDLVHEAQLLRKLQHTNIIELIGTSDEVIDKGRFFVILEKLECTLESKVEKWAKIRGPFKQITPKSAVELRVSLVAIPIASGLEYLHSKSVMYRDLKPGNIGFDELGNIKIFDFGLAIEVPKGKMIKGAAGTLRYMAPEIRSKSVESYGFPVDVYSFAIMLWEIITSRLPFAKEIPASSFSEPKEIPDDKRPNLKYVESKTLAALLGACWSVNPDERWNFEKIILELQKYSAEFALVNGSKMKPPKMKPSSRRLSTSQHIR